MISPSPAPRETWFVDCEWGFLGGRVDMESAFEPVVFCAVGSRSSERLSFWGWEDGLGEFLDAHRADLFVSHNNVAEMKYVLRAGLRLPDRWFDTYVGWRLLTQPARPHRGRTAGHSRPTRPVASDQREEGGDAAANPSPAVRARRIARLSGSTALETAPTAASCTRRSEIGSTRLSWRTARGISRPCRGWSCVACPPTPRRRGRSMFTPATSASFSPLA